MSAIEIIKDAVRHYTKHPVEDNSDFVMDLGMDSLDTALVIEDLLDALPVPYEAWEKFFATLTMAQAMKAVAAKDDPIHLTPKALADYAEAHS